MKRSALIALVVLIISGGAAVSATPGDFKLIVNPSVAGNSISKQAVADIFLGRTVRWGDRSMITAVDYSATSPLRATFSENVLGMGVMAAQTHWLRQMSAGVRPPVTRASDAEVIELVASKPGSIGYVSADAQLPPTVRALTLQ